MSYGKSVTLCRAELGIKPGFGSAPVAHYGFRRDAESLCRFTYIQSAKISQFDNLALARIEFGQFGECVIESDSLGNTAIRNHNGFVQRYVAVFVTTALENLLPGACVIDQNPAHGFRSHSKEVSAIFPTRR